MNSFNRRAFGAPTSRVVHVDALVDIDLTL